MKKIKRLCKSISLTLLFLMSSVGMAYSATTLKNNPVSTNPGSWGETYLTGTTFSIANDDSETDQTYFKLSDVVFGRPVATIEMASNYKEANGNWNNAASSSNPNFTIVTNPADLSYSAKEDGVNRLICQLPSSGETIFKLNVGSYKRGSDFAMSLMVEEISGNADVSLSMTVNGKSIGGSTTTISKNSSRKWQPYEYSLDASNLEIVIKVAEGASNAVLAFSDLYIYGGLEAFSIMSTSTTVSLGTPVTLTAFSALTQDLSAVKWEKRSNSATFSPLMDASGAQLTGASITDVPEEGESCYRAYFLDDQGTSMYSNEVCVSSEYKCATNSAQHNLFIEDFGILSSETSRSSGSVNYINTSIYTFVDNCKPLKAEGTYAIMTNPKFAGYGGLDNNDNSCNGVEGQSLWFRDLYDHTSGGLKNGEWGAMLMVNAANLQGQSEQLVYSRTVDMPCSNTNMIFSAWFANAANPERVSTQISMKFVVRDQNRNIIESATLQIDEIKPEDGWVKGETSFNSGNNDKLTVEIYNCIEGGNGNDFMVDDISFSICVPEVSLSVSSLVPEVEIKDDQVSGSCGSAIYLDLEESMAEVVFDNPYYLWYVKEQGSTEFVHKAEYDNITAIYTQITPYTQYYVVATANEADALDYIAGNLSKCAPVAVSNTITVLCAPNLEVSVKERSCNEVTLEAKKYDDPSGLIDFWWQISKDGKNWSNLDAPKNAYTLEYTLTADTYFRIYTDLVTSPAVKVSLRGINLVATPNKTYIGSNVKLTASTMKYDLGENDKYQWFEKDLTSAGSEYSLIDETTNSFIYYTLKSEKASVKVVAEGCEAEVTIEKLLPIEIQEKSRDCNEITIEGITDIEPSKIKWYYSADGIEYTEYSAVGTPITFDVPEENTNGVYIKAQTTDGKESEPIFVKPIVITNSVYNAEGQELNTQASLIVNDQENITIKTSIEGWTLSAADLITYKSCSGEVLASTAETEFTTAITESNKCFITEFNGCVTEDIEFSIREKELIWPTAFNPLNQDGVNDTFVKGYGIKVMIMDRYGNVVAESEDGWDGTIKGANAMPGVYFYVATLPDETIKKGTIELVHYVK